MSLNFLVAFGLTIECSLGPRDSAEPGSNKQLIKPQAKGTTNLSRAGAFNLRGFSLFLGGVFMFSQDFSQMISFGMMGAGFAFLLPFVFRFRPWPPSFEKHGRSGDTRIAHSQAAAVRVSTFSFAKIWQTCFSTVRLLSPRIVAISRSRLPSLIQRITSHSLGVRPSAERWA